MGWEQVANLGFPAVMAVYLLWSQRQERKECRQEQQRLWAELVRLATLCKPEEKS